MHRGSSKGTRRKRPVPETLPLSASPSPRFVSVEIDVARGRKHAALVTLPVEVGTPIRQLLRSLGHAPEGSAVLLDGVAIPLDTRVERAARFTVVPTFSGG
jgi:sulfur carrier protein ThiS